MNALQILAEQGPGRAFAREQAVEDAALAQAMGYLDG